MAASTAHDDFADLYDATYGRVVAHVYGISGNLADAQEIAQEAFLKAWQRWDSISRYDEPTAWVIRVAHNLALSRWRRARTAAQGLLRLGAPEPDLGPGPESVALVHALRQVSLEQRRALVLHHLSGMPIAQIAVIEKVAEGTIKARLSRGRRALAVLLADDPDRGDGAKPDPAPDPTEGRGRARAGHPGASDLDRAERRGASDLDRAESLGASGPDRGRGASGPDRGRAGRFALRVARWIDVVRGPQVRHA